jgi:pimeloyl-ACP methyl ester carboxylesterase
MTSSFAAATPMMECPTSSHVREAAVSPGRRWPLLLLLLTGCAARQPVGPYDPPTPPRAVVFTLDGAGGYLAKSNDLTLTVAADGLPLAVRPFPWGHGRGRVLADQTDLCQAEEEGRRLAAEAAALMRQCPGLPVSVVAHSAGSLVALEATRSLPPDSLYRLVLLAPAVSAGYDLRPALRCCRGGVEVFYSERDRWALGLATDVVGTTDRRRDDAAGRVGFRVCPAQGGDGVLYARLRQHPWAPEVAWTGNGGGHSGPYQPQFLRAYVLPLLLP